jgi:hypothetical protein
MPKTTRISADHGHDGISQMCLSVYTTQPMPRRDTHQLVASELLGAAVVVATTTSAVRPPRAQHAHAR